MPTKFHSFFASVKNKLRQQASLPPPSPLPPTDLASSPQGSPTGNAHPPNHNSPEPPVQASHIPSTCNLCGKPSYAPAQQYSKDTSPIHPPVSKTYTSLDFARLPEHVLEDADTMNRFSLAASERAQLLVAKHNAERGVHESESLLQMRHRQLSEVVASLQAVDALLDELWGSAVHAPGGLNPESTKSDNPGSTGSEDSA